MIDFAKLSGPFPPHRVSWRVGSTTGDKKRGMALAYIDARDVMERLDDVCGPGGWQCSYPHANGKTVCSIGVKVGDEWIWKADGAGDTDFEADKGALSDAFKRAAVRWGIGRYLYDTAAPWVDIEPAGKSYKIAEHEVNRLMKLLGGQNVAPAPAAAQREPEPPADNPSLDIKTVVADLVATIDRAPSLGMLNALKRQGTDFEVAYGSVPESERSPIKAAWSKRRLELSKSELQMAG